MKRIALLLLLAIAPAAAVFGQDAPAASISNDGNATITSVPTIEPAEVHFFANPVTNVLQITPSVDMDNALLVVSDLRGRVVAKEVFSKMQAGQATEYQMNYIAHGVYVFVLQAPNMRISEKMMVE